MAPIVDYSKGAPLNCDLLLLLLLPDNSVVQLLILDVPIEPAHTNLHY